MHNYEDQMNRFRDHMARSGFSGTAIIDVHPSTGIIRIKMNTARPEQLKPFITGYAQMLNILLTASNIEAKMHVSEEY